MSNFKQLFNESLKSRDTEETIDIYFTRPIGLVFALMWKKLGVHPNAVTALSIMLGIAAGIMFYFPDLEHNIYGVLFLMFANFCDSTDGQLARITGKHTLVGRVLDGFSGDVWFFAIYMAIILRLWNQPMPGTDYAWGIWIFVLAAIAGIMCHSPQSSLSDYYRQIHLFFLKGKAGSELDTYEQQHAILKSLPKKGAWLAKLFYFNYANYCHSQERRTPAFQKLMATMKEKYGGVENIPQQVKDEFLAGSRPLMKFTNILTFNMRAICLYITCLLGCPWVYLLVEIIVMSLIYIYMHKCHEGLCKKIYNDITSK